MPPNPFEPTAPRGIGVGTSPQTLGITGTTAINCDDSRSLT